MIMPIKLIPQEFIDLYDLNTKVKNRYVYIKIQKGMYWLPQVVILANKLLKERLADHGYYEVPHISGLYTHKTRPIWFTLRVDDFSIKYSGKEHADHLLQVLRGHYMVEVDWNGSLYCGITLNWNCKDRYVDIFIPSYNKKTTCTLQTTTIPSKAILPIPTSANQLRQEFWWTSQRARESRSGQRRQTVHPSGCG